MRYELPVGLIRFSVWLIDRGTGKTFQAEQFIVEAQKIPQLTVTITSERYWLTIKVLKLGRSGYKLATNVYKEELDQKLIDKIIKWEEKCAHLIELFGSEDLRKRFLAIQPSIQDAADVHLARSNKHDFSIASGIIKRAKTFELLKPL